MRYVFKEKDIPKSTVGIRESMFATLLCWMILKLKNKDVSFAESMVFVFAGVLETIIYLMIIQALAS